NTSDVAVFGCRFSDDAPHTDALHVGYVDHFSIGDTAFSNVSDDALDLEFADADVRRLFAVDVGDDGLDLMGSTVRVADAVIRGAEGSGISAGEASVVSVQSTRVATSEVGVLAKNAARVSLSGSVLFRNGIGVRTYQRTVRYAGPSVVMADGLFVAQSG